MKISKVKSIQLQQAQEFANKRYFYRKLNTYSAPFANTVEEVMEKFPKITEDEANDIVFEASVYYEEQE